MREPQFKPFALGRYRCEARLRAGGIGDLYLGVHLPTGYQCTLWSVCPELLEDPETETAEQLLQVQLRVQDLNHPNIIPVREILRKEGEIYVVMDYQPGVSLRQVLLQLRETGPLAPALASYVVWQICQALDHAHHLKLDGRPAPLIHGALWPQNVVLSFKGEVCLLDFGTWLIPRASYGDDEVSVRTHFSYRAPEHVTGDTLTRSTDLFCVGILLFEMLTARPLFLAPTLMETVQRVESADLGPMTGVPPALQQVLRRCMAAQPRNRYADVAAFIAELSLVVVGVGDRAIRQELVSFLSANFAVPESVPLRPAPLPGQEEDETTNISPHDLTEVLLALSRERTDPGKHASQAAKPVVTMAERPTDPTRVDGLAPEPIGHMVIPRAEMGEEAPTTVEDSPPVLPGFELPSDRLGVEGAKSGPARLRPVGARDTSTAESAVNAAGLPLFPPHEEEPRQARQGPIKAFGTDETTGQVGRVSAEMGEEEPTTAVGSRGHGNREPAEALPRQPEIGEEEPTTARPQLEPAELPTLRPLRLEALDDRERIPTVSEKPYVAGMPMPPPEIEPPIALSSLPLRPDPPPPRPSVPRFARTPSPSLGSPPDVSRPGPARRPGAPLRREASLRQPPIDARAPTMKQGDLPMPMRAAPSLIGPPGSLARPLPSTLPPTELDLPEIPDQMSSVASGDRDSGLFFEKSSVTAEEQLSKLSVSYEPNEGTPLSDFDPDAFSASYSQSYEAFQKRSRISPAHIMLAVAVVVFLVAVGMLLRRLISQPSAAPTVAAAAPDTRPILPDARRVARDARVRAPAQRDVREVVHPTGKEYDDLLKGRLAEGVMRIESQPAKAWVYLARQLRGLTPLSVRFRVGQPVDVLLVAQGYSIIRRRATLPRGRGLLLKEQLVRSPYPKPATRFTGTLRIRCRGHDLYQRRVFVDDEDTGFPCNRLDIALKSGPHRVALYSVEKDQAAIYRLRIRARKISWLIVEGDKRLR